MNRTSLLVCFFVCLIVVSAFAAETKKDKNNKGKNKKEKDPFVPQEVLDDLTGAIDTGYILTSAVLAFYVQAGYMMLEVGAVRVKNTKNVILKGTMNLCLATFCFWATGFAIGFGVPTDMSKDWEPNPFIGQNLYFLQGIKNTDRVDLFFFYLIFLAVVPCIISGALSERTNFSVYFAHTAVTSLFAWPVLAHWIWGGGWLQTFAQNGFLDYAGGGLVHTYGGTCALVGCVIAGPRLGRFIDGKPREIAGYSTTLVALGVFIQWFGWTGFVTGASGGAVNNLAYVGGKAVANTTIAASFAGVVCLLWSLIWLRDAHLIWILHSINCGLVSISAGAGYVEPWVACIAGCGAPFVYRSISWLLNFLRVDDPMDSVPVHLGGGIYGVLLTGCFATADYIGFIKQKNDVSEYGLFLGGGGEVIGTQFLGLAVIIGWAAVWSAVVFLPFRFLKLFRVDSDTEKKGIDVQGYGCDSWGCVEIVDNGKVDEFQFRIQ